MRRFLIQEERSLPQDSAGTSETEDDHDNQPTASKRARLSCTEKMKVYKKNLKFNPKWGSKWHWVEYSQQEEGMFCEICRKYGKPPASARGAWTSKPVKNWVKATELLRQHEKSEWHLASVEVQAMSSLASTSGNNNGTIGHYRR